MTSIVTLVALLLLINSSQEITCPSLLFDFSNITPELLSYFYKCTVINGSLKLIYLNNSLCSENNFLFPYLSRISGELIVAKSTCLRDISSIYPNLQHFHLSDSSKTNNLSLIVADSKFMHIKYPFSTILKSVNNLNLCVNQNHHQKRHPFHDNSDNFKKDLAEPFKDFENNSNFINEITTTENEFEENCGDVEIYDILDLKKIENCTVANSVLLSLYKHGIHELNEKLAKAFEQLAIIRKSLRIIRSEAIASLQFLKNLKYLGDSDLKSSNIFKMEIRWNTYLRWLWSTNDEKVSNISRKTYIHPNADLVITQNPHLCPILIEKFLQRHLISAADNSSFLEKLKYGRMNGFSTACDIVMTFANVILSKSVPIAQVKLDLMSIVADHNLLLTPIITLKEQSGLTNDSLENKKEIYMANFCERRSQSNLNYECKREASTYDCTIKDLKPATTYSLSLEIPSLYQVQIVRSFASTFTTYAKTPSRPAWVRAGVGGRGTITVSWNYPPQDFGSISFFKVAYREIYLEENDYLVLQNSCSKDKLLMVNTFIHSNEDRPETKASNKSHSKNPKNLSKPISPDNKEFEDPQFCFKAARKCLDIVKVKTLPVSNIYLKENDFDSSLHDSSSKKSLESMVDLRWLLDSRINERFEQAMLMRRSNMLLRERDLLKFYKSINEDKSRVKRSVLEENHNAFNQLNWIKLSPIYVNHSDPFAKTQPYSISVDGLGDFREYSFEIIACQDKSLIRFYGETSCSKPKLISARTDPLYSNDIIDTDSIFIYQRELRINTSQKPDLMFFWIPPKHPNGMIIRYLIRYRRLSNEEVFSTYHFFRDIYFYYYKYFKNQTIFKSVWSVTCLQQEPFSLNKLAMFNFSSIVLGRYEPPKNNLNYTFARLSDNLLSYGVYEIQIMAITLAGNSSWSVPGIQIQIFGLDQQYLDLRSQWIGTNNLFIILFVVFILIGLIIVQIILQEKRLHKRQQEKKAALNENMKYCNLLINNLVDKEWELDDAHLEICSDNLLGRGSFGLVYKGKLTMMSLAAAKFYNIVSNSPSNNSENLQLKCSLNVAIKTLPNDSSFAEMQDFLHEASYLKQFQSPFIVRLFGVCAKQVILNKPPILVLELMDRGDLATFLRNYMRTEAMLQSGTVESGLSIKWAAQIADAMFYMEQVGFIHRDLAARNCLVSSSALTCKIGDFGLTRDIHEKQYYRKQGQARMPIRWMAPETLQNAFFTIHSDVWSYGVTLWEITTFAALPYSGMSHPQVINFVTNGGTLDLQVKCPEILQTVMKNCWKFDLNERISFREILKLLEQYLDSTFTSISYFHNGANLINTVTE